MFIVSSVHRTISWHYIIVRRKGVPFQKALFRMGSLGGGVPSLGVPINSMDVYKQVFVCVCTYVYIMYTHIVRVIHLVSFIH